MNASTALTHYLLRDGQGVGLWWPLCDPVVPGTRRQRPGATVTCLRCMTQFDDHDDASIGSLVGKQEGSCD